MILLYLILNFYLINLTEEERMIGLMKIEHQYIGGTWKESETGVYRTIINPYNQEEIAQVPESDRSDAKLAIKEARKAFDYGEWPKLPGAERGKTLHLRSEERRVGKECN